MKTFEHLSLNSSTLFRVGLQVLAVLLVMLGADGFWTGIVLGILLAVIANEVLVYRHGRRHKQMRH